MAVSVDDNTLLMMASEPSATDLESCEGEFIVAFQTPASGEPLKGFPPIVAGVVHFLDSMAA